MCAVSSVILTVHQRLSCGLETEEVWSRVWWSAHSGLLFADDTSLFGEDVEGLERALYGPGGMVFKMGHET